MAKFLLICTSLCMVLAVASSNASAGPAPGDDKSVLVDPFADVNAAPVDVAQADDTGKARGSAEAKRDKIRKRIRALRAWRLTEALDLDEVTAGKLFPILNRYDDKFAKAMTQTRKLRRQLRQIMRRSTNQSDAEINRLIDEMAAQQRQLWSLQESRFRDVRKVLTPKQAAKIFVVLPAIDRKLHRQIRRAAAGRDKAPAKQRKQRRDKRQRRTAPDLQDPFN